MKKGWSGMNFRNGMHCLGAVTGGSSSGGLSNSSISGNCGGVLSVVRALGVLVCEGRIQGSPRGYKEGPHCTALLQSSPNHQHHLCEKNNYLCNRYLILVKEIAERTAIGASLCVEVFMCSDCQCGLSTVTSNDPVSPIPFTTITQWPHSCEMLLEYWCIGIVPTKSSEMMNAQGLYQAVRSRLHFSQVAAWWSRSNGTKPAYVATRIVPYNIDNRRKFRETPIKHKFPLASIGDGYSVEVTVWALPRMENVPTLICPVHLSSKDIITDDECTARALTPTKNTVSSPRIDAGLVLPSLVDDRLQTPCNKPGKHHCHCEDEDGSPPSPSIKPTGERKRRRSLPCGPSDPNSSTIINLSLASVNEKNSSTNCTSDVDKYSRDHERIGDLDDNTHDNRNYLSKGNIERCFKTQVSLESPEGNHEKRYKPSSDILEIESSLNSDDGTADDIGKFKSFVPFIESQCSIWSLETSLTRHNDKDGDDLLSSNEKTLTTPVSINNSENLHHRLPTSREPNLVVNPFAERSPFHESNPGPSTLLQYSMLRDNINANSVSCTVHFDSTKSNKTLCERPLSYKIKLEKDDVIKNHEGVGKDLSNLMSKLSFPKENDEKIQKEEGGILDWISKVPSRVLNGPNNSTADEKKFPDKLESPQQQQQQNHRLRNAVKFKNSNLELSQREFDEVLAVLRARTPSTRRRTPVKTLRRRERAEIFIDDNSTDRSSTKYSQSEWCICPIHREIKRSTNLSESGGICQLCKNSTAIHRSQMDSTKTNCEIAKDCKQLGKSNEFIQNNSNKTDVLLNAILRTNQSHNRKGLSDISNGARPRTNSTRNGTTTGDNCQSSKKILINEHGVSNIVNFDEDKFMPSALNKRLNRFKQLFRKEHEKVEKINKSIINQYHSNNDSTNNLMNTNEIKKTIIESPKIIGKSSVSYEPLINDNSNNVQSSSHRYSTNYKTNEFTKQSMDASTNKDSTVSSKNRGNNNGYDNVIVIDDDDGDDIVTKKNTNCELKNYNNNNNNNNKKIINNESVEITDDETVDKAVPSAIEQERFRRSFENATSMVFHSRTGLPLTSSPAPLRRGSCCFDYDSTLNSVSSKRSALFELNTPPSPGAVSLEEVDREVENSCEGDESSKRSSSSRNRPQSHALLGSFEESALNGRLEPVSTVHGFTAEIGASGSFCPKHRKLPVTVFFYTLGDNDKVSTPYLAHLNLGKKGYQVPRSGTIQVTLSNPLGTVVKMFVVLYDLSDMPARSHTFLRQRTLRDKTLRYLIHLRFMSGKSGRIYLHTDIRIIICRRSDVDTASDFSSEPPKELRSYIHGPTNPKFSPRC